MSLSRIINDSFFRPSSIFSNEFHQFFNEMERQFAGPLIAADLTPRSNYGPKVNISEEEKHYKVEAEVAGFPKESLSIDFPDANTLHLSGKVAESTALPKDEAKDATNAATTEAEKSDSTQVTAQQASGEVARQSRVWRQEHITRSFSRQFGLPQAVEVDAVQASLNNGILSILMPKATHHVSNRKIEIA